MDAVAGFVTRLRQPEYVEENRCIPCTVANLGIAVVAGGVVGATTWSATTASVGAAAGAAVFAACAAVIYLRGYLVPGTPALTKRYFPVWLLEAFGKDPSVPERTEGTVDQEAILVGVDALEECRDGEDLCLVEEFRRAWYDAIDRVEAESTYDELLYVLNVDEGEVTVEEHGRSVQAMVDGRFAGTWKSRAAFLADVGAASVLAERLEQWDELDTHDRHALLGGLRLFIDECPTCGAAPEMGTEVVETCCASRRTMTIECPECSARLFETAATG